MPLISFVRGGWRKAPAGTRGRGGATGFNCLHLSSEAGRVHHSPACPRLGRRPGSQGGDPGAARTRTARRAREPEGRVAAPRLSPPTPRAPRGGQEEGPLGRSDGTLGPLPVAELWAPCKARDPRRWKGDGGSFG